MAILLMLIPISLVLLGASMSLVPYLFSAGYGALLALRGETYAGQRGLRARDLLVAGLATLYALWLVYAGGLSQDQPGAAGRGRGRLCLGSQARPVR